MEIDERLRGLDWDALAQSLDLSGYARTPVVLTPDECAELIAMYEDRARFRSRVDMARFRFGVGLSGIPLTIGLGGSGSASRSSPAPAPSTRC